MGGNEVAEDHFKSIRKFSASQLRKAKDHFKKSHQHHFVSESHEEEEDPPVSAIDLGSWNKGTLEDGHLVLIKESRGSRLEDVARDISMVSRMSSHRNVLRVIGCCLEPPVPVLVYEDAENGSLDRLVYKGSLAWKTRLKIARDIADVVSYLHNAFSTPIVHRNITTKNIFLDKDYVAKLSDFSHSISIPQGKSHVKVEDHCRGTFHVDEYDLSRTKWFMDPEYLKTHLVTDKTDVYSFGVLLLVLLTGRAPLKGGSSGSVMDVSELIKNGLIEPGAGIIEQQVFSEMQSSHLELAMSCISPCAAQRPTMIQEEESRRWFLENGNKLLEELAALCDGRSNPIRYFSASQLQKAIEDFRKIHDPLEIIIDWEWHKGVLDDRLVLIRKNNGSHCQEICRDIAITSQMSSHKNVLRLVGCCLELPAPALVYEFPANRSLDRLVRDKSLPWKTRLRIAKETAHAISYLHNGFSRPIIHRHIKPANVFLDQHYCAKLVDFSMSITIPEGESRVEVESIMGTMGYVDPEYFLTSSVTEETDVYGFGVVLLVLLTGRDALMVDPVSGKASGLVEYVNDLVRKDRMVEAVDRSVLEVGAEMEQTQLQVLLELAMRCTSPSGEERPTMIQVTKQLEAVANKWFKT
ncbi:hypothetical protein Tsubulata_025700 [Turnera subulata]|uniref:Protein kinase domain-containing protein n=1 Tax=Turnera subulata TaxID=218843 RepID=A0A9Q0G194_9ROSI|nr:hypothetical protein Tsubulata_025700 [Turnera subulata]